MTLDRHGSSWTPADDELLHELVRGPATLDEIAAALQRTAGAVCARLGVVVEGGKSLERTTEAFEQARVEIRKGGGGQTDGAQILRTWRSITGIELTESLQHQFLARAEVKVLAGFEPEHRLAAGTALWAARGRLALDNWVLECDWRGVADLHLTAEEVRAAADTVGPVGRALVEAALKKVTQPRNREILAARLGLRGDSVAFRQIGEQHGISGERIRQLQETTLRRFKRVDNSMVRRSWHHARDTLRPALVDETQSALDPRLADSFARLALPAAPPDLAAAFLERL